MKAMEKIHLDAMMDTYREYLTTKSWKRRRDLKRHLASLESDWFDYMRIKQEERIAGCLCKNT